MTNSELKNLLDERVLLYNNKSFIETDPIQIPKKFGQKENIEISGFMAATIAWGQRPTIIRNAMQLVELMENNPIEFLLNTRENDWLRFEQFKHRTFNGTDCICFLRSLKNIYMNHGGLEAVFRKGYQEEKSIASSLRYFREIFFEVAHERRSQKHVPNIDNGAAAKRINMFLRWMVRKDKSGVDFGLWKDIPMSALKIPLDVHAGTQARLLGLLTRTQNDWKAVEELTARLTTFDPHDPVKYDFALFGMGVNEKSNKPARATGKTKDEKKSEGECERKV